MKKSERKISQCILPFRVVESTHFIVSLGTSLEALVAAKILILLDIFKEHGMGTEVILINPKIKAFIPVCEMELCQFVIVNGFASRFLKPPSSHLNSLMEI